MEAIFTDREADLMEILWEHGSSTAAEVREYLREPLAYNTVLTILRTLEAKGHVGHEAEGRTHRYIALVPRDVARRSAVRALSSKLFKGSVELLMTHIVSEQKLSAAQLKKIRQLLDKSNAKERP